MNINEIDTGCLEAKKGATIVKMVSLQDVIEMLEELKKALNNNSSCDCTLATDKYSSIVDALVLLRLKNEICSPEVWVDE